MVRRSECWLLVCFRLYLIYIYIYIYTSYSFSTPYSRYTELEGKMLLTRTLVLNNCTSYTEQIPLVLGIYSACFRQPYIKILVHSLRRICSYGNWKHPEEFEQVPIAHIDGSLYHYSRPTVVLDCILYMYILAQLLYTII